MIFTIKKSKIAAWGYEITAKGFHNIAPSVETAINYLRARYGPHVKYRVKAGKSVSRYFAYLDQLRESGVTNMLGAAPYLQEEFPELADDKARAAEILCAWMRERSRG